MPRRPRRPSRPRPEPQAIDTHSATAGLRAVASFEAIKGTLVLLLEIGLLSLLHRDAVDVAEHVVRMLHLNPEHNFSHAILHAASKLTDAKLWAMAAGGLVYTIVRYVEAYGLWHRRVWAEWFALLSGTLYLPWEIYELVDRSTPIRWIILLSNIAIVMYMAQIRWKACRPGQGCAETAVVEPI